jgi:FkbM family methyltransferase
MMIAQAIINALSLRPQQHLLRKLHYSLLYCARQTVLQFHDPLIHYPVGDRRLFFPLSSNFPFTCRRHPYYATNVARIAYHVHQHYPDLRFIDVGAYVGDTVAVIRQQAAFPILAIEGNDAIYRILEKNMMAMRQVDLVRALIGNPSRSEIEASQNTPASQTHMSLMQILDQFPQYRPAKMLKIDTDGYDGHVLRGAGEFLSTAHPIIFFEYDPDLLVRYGDHGLSVLRLLREMGYQTALFYEHTGEYILSATLDNTSLLEDLTQWYSGFGGHRYCDLCVFHADDEGLCQTIRRAELAYFQKARQELSIT